MNKDKLYGVYDRFGMLFFLTDDYFYALEVAQACSEEYSCDSFITDYYDYNILASIINDYDGHWMEYYNFEYLDSYVETCYE